MVKTIDLNDTIDGSKIVCGCFNFTVNDIHSVLDANPKLQFQEFLDHASIGNKCTACLLDLEYHFVDHKAKSVTLTGNKNVETKIIKRIEPRNLKQRFYSILDRISPNVAYPFENPMPILYGPGIEQWVQVINRSMLFDKETYASDMEVSLVIRSSTGKVIESITEKVGADGVMRTNVSALLEAECPLPNDEMIGIGWVNIQRKGLAEGVRGTTRPQVEIITAGGACAVHSQAKNGPTTKGFTALCAPNDERLFLSFINTENKILKVSLSYPLFINVDDDDNHAKKRVLSIAPHCVVLHELDLKKFVGSSFENALMNMVWKTDGPFKAHVFCASKSLDRFSIDHV